MDVQATLEALYQKALDLKTRGMLPEAEAVEGEAAGLLSELRKFVEDHPEDPASAQALLVLAEKEWALLGDHEQVHSKLSAALALRLKRFGPDHVLTAEALAKLAEFHYLSGRFGEAELHFQRALPIFEKEQTPSPFYARALEGLAQTLATLGRTEEADGVFAKAIAHMPSDAQGKRSLYFLLIARADGLEKLGRAAEAGPLRQQAVALLPKNNPGELGFHV